MSQVAPFRVTPLESALDRTAFSSGIVPLDGYFKTQVTQDIKRRVTVSKYCQIKC